MNSTPYPPVAVIITAWNQLEKTTACLQTVLALDYPAFDVFLVDNGSSPPLRPLLEAQFPSLNYLTLAQNVGFAGGYNAGLKTALAHQNYAYFWLLNNDTLCDPHALTALVETMSARPELGLATAKIYYAHEPQRLWTAGANYHPLLLELVQDVKGELDRGQWPHPRPVEFAPFCAILLRRTVVEEVGLLDEQYFLYYEDMDYCRRAMRQGQQIAMLPQAVVWHAVSSSTGGADSPLERFWMAQSSGRYFRTHSSWPQLLVIAPYRWLSAWRTTGRLLWAGQFRACSAYWLGLAYGWGTGRATTPPPAWVLPRQS